MRVPMSTRADINAPPKFGCSKLPLDPPDVKTSDTELINVSLVYLLLAEPQIRQWRFPFSSFMMEPMT